jgi:integrase
LRVAGIVKRHSKRCACRSDRACDCEPTWQAWVYSKRDRRKIRRTFPTHAAARSWRAQAQREVETGARRAASRLTVRRAADAWLDGARSGEVRTRSGATYKPSAIRGYEQALRLRVLPAIGGARLADLTTADLQRLVDLWQAEGLGASTIRNTIKPLQAIYRRARVREGLPINPTVGLELPAARGRRERIVPPETAAMLIAALPAEERALWATALYAGLRLGELRALRWDAVDLAGGTIEVRGSWDPKEGPIAPKSAAGRRKVPVPAALRDVLVEHRLASGRGEGLVFSRDGLRPFSSGAASKRADRAWRAAGLESIRLHEARHTFASFMIAAGVNAKALSTYMGHGSITITFDRYGHLMPGNEAEAAGLLDAYLARGRHSAPASRALAEPVSANADRLPEDERLVVE